MVTYDFLEIIYTYIRIETLHVGHCSAEFRFNERVETKEGKILTHTYIQWRAKASGQIDLSLYISKVVF